MVATLLEGVVEEERVEQLRDGYREIAADLPDVLVETFLIRDVGAEASFGILTIWSRMEAVQEMRREAESRGGKPAGVRVFESVGVRPSLRIFDVVHHGAQPG